MVGIKQLKDDQIIEIGNGHLYESILDVCADHQASGRALAFGFLIFNSKNPQIFKIINDPDYWRALHDTVGKYISIFYVLQPYDDVFGRDLIDNNGQEQRGFHEVRGAELIPMLKPYFQLDENVELPAILFFQTRERMIIDYFLIGLNELRVEDTFLELQKYLKDGVNMLEGVKEENYQNSQEIFNLLKSGVKSTSLKRWVFKTTQTFPIQLLAKWLIGKL